MAVRSIRPSQIDRKAAAVINQLSVSAAETRALQATNRTMANELKAIQATNRTLLNELKTVQATNRTMLNELKADYNSLLAKLDADTGITDTNYAATLAIAAADISAVAAADIGAVSAADIAAVAAPAPDTIKVAW